MNDKAPTPAELEDRKKSCSHPKFVPAGTLPLNDDKGGLILTTVMVCELCTFTKVEFNQLKVNTPAETKPEPKVLTSM